MMKVRKDDLVREDLRLDREGLHILPSQQDDGFLAAVDNLDAVVDGVNPTPSRFSIHHFLPPSRVKTMFCIT
jgi:hypothetical protein